MSRKPGIQVKRSNEQKFRWRWYHYYFLLAFFDILVIVATLTLYHQNLSSYDLALTKLAKNHAKQRWVQSLRLAVIELNAPGNDVFASRQVERERARFIKAQEHMQELLAHGKNLDVDVSEFQEHIRKMVAIETEILNRFAVELGPDKSMQDIQNSLAKAAAQMAVMDRHQADSVTALSELDQYFLMRIASLLNEYGDRLEQYAAFEKFFLAIIVVILVAVFWFGRQLQLTDEQIVLGQQHVHSERQQRLAEIGELCAGVAHGIRNPLAAISSSAQLALNYGEVDSATKSRISDVLTECSRLEKRVSRLLSFSAAPNLSLEKYDLCGAVKQAVDEIAPTMAAGKIRFQVDIHAAEMTVRGDRERMVQSVIEIISNAMDHVSSEGTIQVNCTIDSGVRRVAVIDVVDDGPGIPENARARVFDLFYTTREQGIGIGLASVKRAVEFQGGTVAVVPSTKGAHIRILQPLDS